MRLMRAARRHHAKINVLLFAEIEERLFNSKVEQKLI